MNQRDRIDLARRSMGMLLAFMLTMGAMLNVSAFAEDVLIRGVTAVGSSSWDPTPTAQALVNDSGMSDAATPITVPFSVDPTPTHGSANYSDEWGFYDQIYWDGGPWPSDPPNGIFRESVVFTFTAKQDIAEFAVWNSSVETPMGVKDLTIWTSVSASGDADWVKKVGGNPDDSWTFAEYDKVSGAGQGFVLSGNWTGARRVKFVISSSYGSNIAGLSEVRFYRAAATSKKGMLLCFQ